MSTIKYLLIAIVLIFTNCTDTNFLNKEAQKQNITLINCRQILRNHETHVKSIFRAVQWEDQKYLAIDSFGGYNTEKKIKERSKLNKDFIQAHHHLIDSFLSTNDLEKLYFYGKKMEQKCTDYQTQWEYNYKSKSDIPDFSKHLNNGIDENRMLHFIKALNQFIDNRFKNAHYGILMCSFNEDVVYNQATCYKDQKYSFAILGTVLDVKVKSATCNGKPIDVKLEFRKQQSYWVVSVKPKEYGKIDITFDAKRFDFGMGVTTQPYFVTFKHINK